MTTDLPAPDADNPLSANTIPSRPLRVSFLLSSLRLSGGVRAVVEYANRLAARGHHLTLVAPRDTLDSATAREIDNSVSIRESARPLRTGGAAPNARLAWSLAAATPVSDVVVSTHTPTTASGLIATRLLRRGRGVWLYMDYVEMFAGRPAETWLLRNAMRWNSLALTISHASARELAARTSGRIEFVGLGMSHSELLSPAPFAERKHDGPPVVLYLGDSRPRKGLADLVAAAESLHNTGVDLTLAIASKEEFTPATRLPVEFHLLPSNEQLARLYQSCHVFVSASWSEGLGWPALEAMACATPVVLTDSGGSRDYAEDGVNCLVTPPQNPQMLAAALRRVLTNHELCQRLSANGPPTAARFEWSKVIDRLEQALLRVASQ